MQPAKAKIGRELFLVFWGAFTASQAIYLAALMVMPQRAAALGSDAVEKLAIAMGVSSILALAGAFLLPRLLLPSKASSANTAAMSTDEANRLACERGLVPYIFRLALFEMVCVLGFVAAFLTKNVSLFFPFLVVSSLGLAFSFPSWAFLRSFALDRS